MAWRLRILNSGVKHSGLPLSIWPWANYLTSLTFKVLTCCSRESPKMEIPPLPVGACHSSHQEVESISPPLQSGLALWLALTTGCSKRDILGLSSPGLKTTGNFCFLTLETQLLCCEKSRKDSLWLDTWPMTDHVGHFKPKRTLSWLWLPLTPHRTEPLKWVQLTSRIMRNSKFGAVCYIPIENLNISKMRIKKNRKTKV